MQPKMLGLWRLIARCRMSALYTLRMKTLKTFRSILREDGILVEHLESKREAVVEAKIVREVVVVQAPLCHPDQRISSNMMTGPFAAADLTVSLERVVKLDLLVGGSLMCPALCVGFVHPGLWEAELLSLH